MELSIVIPARNEIFLGRTIQDIIEHAESDYEIIAVLDGFWPDVGIPQNEHLTLLHYPESIGQRAATNAAAKIARGKYIMKCDAHCAFAPGFDRILLEDIQDDWTIVPVMKNLHAFDWVCPNGHRRYQGPSGDCKECGETTTMDIVWIAKPSPNSSAYRFDKTLHFQYWPEYKKQQIGDLVESMSLQGSCFMLTKDKYFDLNICDESWGSWGQQGVEVAVKTWLSGGKVIVDKRTWYAHMFRTQGGDFGFPYPLSGNQVEHARRTSREILQEDKWEKAIHPFRWLIDKFNPPDWESPKGIVYYTDNQLDPKIMEACQKQLIEAANGIRIISVGLQKTDFAENITLDLERGYLAMFKQILAGLEAHSSDIIFLCEHDILYHPTHFDFIPPEKDKFYYNNNVWKVRYPDGHAIHYDCRQTSGLCAYRELLIKHYKQRIENTEKMWDKYGGNTREFRNFIRFQGFEPGSHHRVQRVDDYKSDVWSSEFPNIDIRHNHNLTPNRWNPSEFRDKRCCRNWIESDEIIGWGNTKELMEKISK